MARRKNPEGLPANEWIPAHAVRFNQDGSVSMMTETERNPYDPDESLQDRSLREWAENFTRVAQDPEAASEKDLRRAIGYLDRMRRHVIRKAQEQGRRVDANVLAGYDNEEAYYLRLIQEHERKRERNVTDRALRYRANAEPPPGEKICAFCGSRRFVEVGHVDGHEENTNPRNLIWNCRSCNTQMGMHFKRRGAGRRTHQYNPSTGGAKTLGAWINAVLSMKGESEGPKSMTVSEAVQLIHDTPPSRRSRFAEELYELRRRKGTAPPRGGYRDEVPF